jgi:hypothetical protein
VPEIGVAPALVALNDGTSPMPFATSPIAVLLFVHANVVPGVGLLNALAGTVVPLQTTIFEGTETVGVGFIVIIYVEGVPGHPFAEGVTVIVPDIGVVPELVAVNAGTFPMPLAPSPIEVLLFDHAKVAPGVILVNALTGTVAPLQTAKFAGTTTVGVGFTVII